MALIESIYYPNRRVYLTDENIGINIQPIDWYKEIRTRRRLNLDNGKKFYPLINAFGNQSIGGSKFTPRFVNLATGVRIVPFDATSKLDIRGGLISIDDGLEGADLFDRSDLVSSVNVDYQPPQVEIIQVNSGSGLSSSQASQLASLAATLSSYGVFSSESLINAPGGSGGGSATIENQRAMLNYLYALLSEII